MPSKEQLPGREELRSLGAILGETFIQRRDLYAKQLDDGGYVSIKKPLRPSHLEAHVRGHLTLGAYLLDRESRGRFLVYDADNAPDWRRLRALARVLAELGSASYLEESRRGGHLWLFFAEPVPAENIRGFGQGLLNHFGIAGVELFPKQSQLTSGPGSLIRLPFGVHRKSGARYGFHRPDGSPLAETLREQIRALGAPETLSKPFLDRFLSDRPKSDSEQSLETTQRPLRQHLSTAEAPPLSDRIKNAITVRQFVLRYVELSPQGQGLCPFHDDQVASFSVKDEDNFWTCFACQKGGSIIDFWMNWQQCDFQTAIKELAKMLL